MNIPHNRNNLKKQLYAFLYLWNDYADGNMIAENWKVGCVIVWVWVSLLELNCVDCRLWPWKIPHRQASLLNIGDYAICIMSVKCVSHTFPSSQLNYAHCNRAYGLMTSVAGIRCFVNIFRFILPTTIVMRKHSRTPIIRVSLVFHVFYFLSIDVFEYYDNIFQDFFFLVGVKFTYPRIL